MIKESVRNEIRRYKEEYSPVVRELPDKLNVSRFIDHTLLKADATPEMVRKLCEEAMRYEFWSVCVNSGYIPLATKLLAESDVKKTVVVGFPLGQMSSEAKVFEASWAS
ncbi:deoxyribose-phosphate aldolase, partial [Mesotoga sp. SC_4PWL113PWK15]